MLRLAFERRTSPMRLHQFGAPMLALLLTLIVSLPSFAALGLSPLQALQLFFLSPLSTANGVSGWFLKASPLILIGLGLSVGFRANVWNIGAEGMFTIGAICAGWLALHFGDERHWWLIPAMMLAGVAGGMAWAAVPALLKTRANTNEILVSLMLNYVAALLLGYLVNGPMQDPQGLNYPQTAQFGPAALFSPLHDGMRINSSIFITMAAVVVAWVLLERSFLGFQLRVAGSAPRAARYAGFSQARLVWLSFLVSGATAGLAGMMEAAGPLGQLVPIISPGYGFAAIIVAFVGRLNAVGVVFGALLMSLLYLGGEALQMTVNVPASLSRSFQGILLLFLLATDTLMLYRIRVRRL